MDSTVDIRRDSVTIEIMASSNRISFRVDDQLKARIEAAACIQGKSVTTFAKEVLMTAVEQIESRPRRQPKPHVGVPTFFRALCHEAGQGGSFGFRTVGQQFAQALGGLIPEAQDFDGWQAELDALAQLLVPARKWEAPALIRRTEMSEAVWGWFARNYPNAMKLVPERRRDQFLMGVYDAFADETIGLRV
jgi:hypothetical protein